MIDSEGFYRDGARQGLKRRPCPAPIPAFCLLHLHSGWHKLVPKSVNHASGLKCQLCPRLHKNAASFAGSFSKITRSEH